MNPDSTFAFSRIFSRTFLVISCVSGYKKENICRFIIVIKSEGRKICDW